MAAPTLTEQVFKLRESLSELVGNVKTQGESTDVKFAYIERRFDELITRFDKQQEKIAELTAKSAALEERYKALETLSTRAWQVWLALIVAGIGLVVTLVKK